MSKSMRRLRPIFTSSPNRFVFSAIWAVFIFGVPFVSSHSLNPLRRYTGTFCHFSRLPSHRKVHDLPDHLGIGEAGFLRSHGEFLSAGEPWVRICLDDVNLALAR
jgi:hypothetical protein